MQSTTALDNPWDCFSHLIVPLVIDRIASAVKWILQTNLCMAVNLFNCTGFVQFKSITVLYDSYSTVMQPILYEKYSMLHCFDPPTQSIGFPINFNQYISCMHHGCNCYAIQGNCWVRACIVQSYQVHASVINIHTKTVKLLKWYGPMSQWHLSGCHFRFHNFFHPGWFLWDSFIVAKLSVQWLFY